MTTTDTPTLSKQLKALAEQFDAAARRSDTLAESDDRHRNASQLRFVAALAVLKGYKPLAEAWIDAGKHMLEAYDRADMDAIYESRAARRAGKVKL